MKRTKDDWVALISFLLAIWFLLAGTVWVYGAALIIAYPFGIVSLIMWVFFLKGERKKSKLIPFILLCGACLSILLLYFTWLFDK